MESTESRKWRRFLLRIGFVRGMLAVTVFSIFGSLLISFPLFFYFGIPASAMYDTMLIAVIVPLVVAPIAAYEAISLIFELDTARTTLTRLAIHDGLTNAFNRRHFDLLFADEGTRAIRSNSPLSVLMIDADKFKNVNDRHGHAMGDRVLQEIANACASCMRTYDMLARYGGEEFVVLLPSTTLEQACEIAERVRIAVSMLNIVSSLNEAVPITVSLGVGMLLVGDTSADQALLRADKALYEAKRTGRNKWMSQ